MTIEHLIGVVIILLLIIDVYLEYQTLKAVQLQPGRW